MKHFLLKSAAFTGMLIACTWLTLKLGDVLAVYM